MTWVWSCFWFVVVGVRPSLAVKFRKNIWLEVMLCQILSFVRNLMGYLKSTQEYSQRAPLTCCLRKLLGVSLVLRRMLATPPWSICLRRLCDPELTSPTKMSEFEGPLKEDMVHTVDTSMSRKQLIAKQSKKKQNTQNSLFWWGNGVLGPFLDKTIGPVYLKLSFQIQLRHDRILYIFFWPGLKQDVVAYCKSCCVCQGVNRTKLYRFQLCSLLLLLTNLSAGFWWIVFVLCPEQRVVTSFS